MTAVFVLPGLLVLSSEVVDGDLTCWCRPLQIRRSVPVAGEDRRPVTVPAADSGESPS